MWIDRLEATIESHQMAAAEVREARGIPGTSLRTTWLCRDKPSMKEALRQAGVPTAASTAADSAAEVRAFAEQTGFPLILKPRSGAGAQGTVRVDSMADARTAALGDFGGAGSIAVEEFVEGHEGFYDTIADRRPRRPRLGHPLLPQRARGDAAPLDHPAVHHHQPDHRLAVLRRGPRDGPPRHRGARHHHVGHPHGVVLRAEGAAVLRDRLPAAGRRRVGPLLRGQRRRRLPRVGPRDRARRARAAR